MVRWFHIHEIWRQSDAAFRTTIRMVRFQSSILRVRNAFSRLVANGYCMPAVPALTLPAPMSKKTAPSAGKSEPKGKTAKLRSRNLMTTWKSGPLNLDEIASHKGSTHEVQSPSSMMMRRFSASLGDLKFRSGEIAGEFSSFLGQVSRGVGGRCFREKQVTRRNTIRVLAARKRIRVYRY